jgi:hypothetical protein
MLIRPGTSLVDRNLWITSIHVGQSYPKVNSGDPLKSLEFAPFAR